MEEKKTIKSLIDANDFIMAPGAYDALGAKIIESEGFNAVYMTGYGTSAAVYGLPDRGLLTMTEMVKNAARISDVINIPLIADADTGYGTIINVDRTVREYEKIGVSAIHIEDQVWPKRCGHMVGKEVIEAEDMVAKIETAVNARANSDFLIIARTDAIATHGFDNAIERAKMYTEAGADILFVEAPRTKNKVKKVPKLLTQKPLLINLSPRTPVFSVEELKTMGYSIAIYPGMCLAATILACKNDLNILKQTGKPREFEDVIQSFSELNEFIGV
ncbi:MAG: carboxyvinyl-carboxyphosphonate phosphorylmutase, partial [Candidatus Lokiarchaeota archaeon]|nr:carboxyvinyl-carboxyphosphonate phosphorylmutase [Candidatus Lokiarchaeota archaeon]MBD3340097.1 carboxyvinyl-carboxyphosphonate phosphorylmutase [Candidatus Lokiarchaeota archaeon]